MVLGRQRRAASASANTRIRCARFPRSTISAIHGNFACTCAFDRASHIATSAADGGGALGSTNHFERTLSRFVAARWASGICPASLAVVGRLPAAVSPPEFQIDRTEPENGNGASGKTPPAEHTTTRKSRSRAYQLAPRTRLGPPAEGAKEPTTRSRHPDTQPPARGVSAPRAEPLEPIQPDARPQLMARPPGHGTP
jgi:hypothetical protein